MAKATHRLASDPELLRRSRRIGGLVRTGADQDLIDQLKREYRRDVDARTIAKLLEGCGELTPGQKARLGLLLDNVPVEAQAAGGGS
jgi:hypothetical protein